MNWLKRYYHELCDDFIHCMDTQVPRGVNRRKYINVKYSNRKKMTDLEMKYPIITRSLLEKVAMKEFLDNSEEHICAKLSEYLEGP